MEFDKKKPKEVPLLLRPYTLVWFWVFGFICAGVLPGLGFCVLPAPFIAWLCCLPFVVLTHIGGVVGGVVSGKASAGYERGLKAVLERDRPVPQQLPPPKPLSPEEITAAAR